MIRLKADRDAKICTEHLGDHGSQNRAPGSSVLDALERKTMDRLRTGRVLAEAVCTNAAPTPVASAAGHQIARLKAKRRRGRPDEARSASASWWTYAARRRKAMLKSQAPSTTIRRTWASAQTSGLTRRLTARRPASRSSHAIAARSSYACAGTSQVLRASKSLQGRDPELQLTSHQFDLSGRRL